jgi:glycine/D-amino acid oxidase-like deaminating enzyme
MQPGMTTTNTQLKRAGAVMQQKFDKRFPQLAGMKMAYTWSGHLCLSTNHVSVTGKLDDNLYAACVQNGLGTARGTLTGICAAEQAVGHQSEITEFFAAEKEPKRLPPQPFASIGANLFIRYKEWRAQEE